MGEEPWVEIWSCFEKLWGRGCREGLFLWSLFDGQVLIIIH